MMSEAKKRLQRAIEHDGWESCPCCGHDTPAQDIQDVGMCLECEPIYARGRRAGLEEARHWAELEGKICRSFQEGLKKHGKIEPSQVHGVCAGAFEHAERSFSQMKEPIKITG